ncbi:MULTISPECIES: M4 family metallopeptidase [Streptomyces]|uniref:M4 family metallopeptidase n=1 Tax=Streptomyces TaxID=1883 RepID=UPI0015CF31F5|nr:MULTISPECIES: M4 family metallopeptidase [Streptomyces]MCX4501026.1 M4 family metallopeptidase [Streptomyces anulatus]
MTTHSSLSPLKRTVFDAKHTDTLPGEKVRGEGEGPVADAAVNRVHDNLGVVHDFFSTVYGRDSLFLGGALEATVHYGGPSTGDVHWDGSRLVIAETDEEVFCDLTLGLDLLAAGLASGLVQHSAGLTAQGQSGALHYSIADVFGSLVKQYTGQQSASKADWLLGAEVFTPDVPADAKRSLKSPGTAYDSPLLGKDPQRAHMDDYLETPEGDAGAFVNSGIPNHAFYLLATKWGGNAWERAGKVWYTVLTGGSLKAESDFADFARLTSTAATTLYGEGESLAVKEAWNKVGVA